MSVIGTIYGVALNDREERERLAPQLGEKPYLAPPIAPIVYVKPRTSIARGGVVCASGEIACAPTIALLMARDATRLDAQVALACIGAIALAIDFSLPEASYYRPAVAQRNAEEFLGLGAWQAPGFPQILSTVIDGRPTHEWPLDRLSRSPAQLIAELSQFMTLRAGDVLLVGLPGDAPRAVAGQSVSLRADGFPALDLAITRKPS